MGRDPRGGSPKGRLTIYWGSAGTFGSLQTKLSAYELI